MTAAGNSSSPPRGFALLALLSLLCLWSASSGVKAEDLTPAEISTILEEVKLEEPVVLQGKPISELVQALDQVSPEALLEAATNIGLVNETAAAAGPADAEIVTPELVTEVVLAGLTAPQGTAGTEAPPPADVAAASPLDAPEDCPSWACVCEGQAAGARVAVPNDAECSAFITCTGNGDGSKHLCPVAGTGFNPSSQLCEALAAPSEGGQLCVFNQGVVQALQIGPADDGSDAVLAADSAAAASNTVTLTCDALTSSRAHRNIKAMTSDELLLTPSLGNNFCTLAKPEKPGCIQLSAGTANTSITAVVLRFLEQGTGATISVSAGGKGPRIVLNKPAAAPPTAASEAAPGIWLPKAAAHAFPRLAGRITIELSPFPEGGSLRLVSVSLTTVPTPAKPTKQDAVLSARQVQALLAATNATTDSSTALVGLSSNDMYSTAPGWRPPRRGSGGGGVSVQRARAWRVSPRVVEVAELMADRASQLVSAVLEAYKNTVTEGASACYRESYDRGVGTIPTNCFGWSNEAGICYDACGSNYNTVWFVCWQMCSTVPPHNWQDHGVTCHIPMHSYWNRNNGCAWYDICGTWARRGCRSCDSGYNRHGCVCTRPPRWHTKHSYTRASRLPGCSDGREKQNGLCYKPCAAGHWGEAFMCYNHCPDIMPPLVARLSAAQLDVCSSYHVNLPTNMAFVTVDDRDFKGTDVAFHRHSSFEDCLMHCKHNPACQFVVHVPWWDNMCVLKKDIAANGPHESNAYMPSLRTAVAITRLNQDQTDCQWARSEGADAGAIIRVRTGEKTSVDSIVHARNGAQNTILCQLLCLGEKGCTHVVHNAERCWLMNRRGSPSTTVSQATNTIVNMQRWNDFDRVAKIRHP